MLINFILSHYEPEQIRTEREDTLRKRLASFMNILFFAKIMGKALWLSLAVGITFAFLVPHAFGESEYNVSPLKQWKSGASPVEISCSEGKFLVINPDSQKPACLFPSTSMIRFAENGWLPVRNIVLENPKETTVSGHGGEFTKRYFSFFEIRDQNSIIVHKINDKSLAKAIHAGDRIISNCVDDEGSSEITVSTLVQVNSVDNTVSMTHEKQTWPEGFCGNNESILEQYYAKFFARDMSESGKLESLYSSESAVRAFHDTYEDVQVSVREDHVSYFSGSDEGYFVRMNLFFDENHDITNIDFHCYFQRVHQFELPQEYVEQKIARYDCKEYWKTSGSGPDSSTSFAELEVDVTGQQQVRRGTTHDIVVDVSRDANPVPDAQVRITIEDYGEDVIRDFKGRTDDSGRFVFSWEIPKRFDDIKTLLAYVDVTDDVSAKTTLFKFQVYCLPGEAGCKIEGN